MAFFRGYFCPALIQNLIIVNHIGKKYKGRWGSMYMKKAAVPIFNLGFDDPKVFIEQYRIVSGLLKTGTIFGKKKNVPVKLMLPKS